VAARAVYTGAIRATLARAISSRAALTVETDRAYLEAVRREAQSRARLAAARTAAVLAWLDAALPAATLRNDIH
jgi:hypothetical protein